MTIKIPKNSDFTLLPLRVAVAYAARCSRRILPLCNLREINDWTKTGGCQVGRSKNVPAISGRRPSIKR